MDEGYLFHDYINILREKEGFTMQEACEGLCTAQEIKYLEEGERVVGNLLQETVLERLGVGAQDSENYLYYEEYRRWEDRQHILHSISYEKFEEAEELMERYRLEYCRPEKDGEIESDMCEMKTECRLECQFYFSLLAQLRRCQGAGREELYRLFDKALVMTVPDWQQSVVRGKVLSMKELNLLLETERYRREGERPERYREIVEYIEGRKLDNRGEAKIYPKAVFYLCRSVVSQGRVEKGSFSDMVDALSSETGGKFSGKWTAAGLLRYCHQAIEILRDNGRSYYMWELLSLKEEFLKRLEEEATEWEEKSLLSRMVSLEPLKEENRKWKEVLEQIYKEAGIPVETYDDCYLYVVKGVQCINDVIRIRREMFGLSRKELCEGFCDIKTLKRLEERKTRPQRAVAQGLFEKLGLSREFTRTELVTSSPEAKEMWDKIRDDSYNEYFDQVEKKLGELEKLVSVKIKSNDQLFKRKRAFLLWKNGEIGKEEYCRKMQSALEVTMSYEAFLKEGEKYLTYEEQKCVHNKMLGMDRNSEEFMTCMKRFEEIYTPYADKGMLEVVMGMYDFIMTYVGSMWGNKGEYDRADKYNEIIRQGCLRFRQIGALHDSFYDRWWNNMKRVEEGIAVERVLDAEEELTKCIIISIMDKCTDEDFYQKKLASVRKGHT